MSALTQQANIFRRCLHVGFGPGSDIRPLFDHLVGEHQQVMRDGEAECIGGLEVDNEVEFGRLLNRDIARLCPV